MKKRVWATFVQNKSVSSYDKSNPRGRDFKLEVLRMVQL